MGIVAPPPFGPDLAPSDFFLFPKLKEHLKGVRFNITDEAKHKARTWLRNQPGDFLKNGMETPLRERSASIAMAVMLRNKFIVQSNQKMHDLYAIMHIFQMALPDAFWAV